MDTLFPAEHPGKSCQPCVVIMSMKKLPLCQWIENHPKNQKKWIANRRMSLRATQSSFQPCRRNTLEHTENSDGKSRKNEQTNEQTGISYNGREHHWFDNGRYRNEMAISKGVRVPYYESEWKQNRNQLPVSCCKLGGTTNCKNSSL